MMGDLFTLPFVTDFAAATVVMSMGIMQSFTVAGVTNASATKFFKSS